MSPALKITYDLAIKKAKQSGCEYKVAALGFNRKGECVDKTTNIRRFFRKGGGLHAEMILMSRARQKGTVMVLICRVGKSGMPLPIDPCPVCAEKAQELGIKIITVPSKK